MQKDRLCNRRRRRVKEDGDLDLRHHVGDVGWRVPVRVILAEWDLMGSKAYFILNAKHVILHIISDGVDITKFWLRKHISYPLILKL